MILGDAATAFVAPRPGGPEPDAAIGNEIASTVKSVSLPELVLNKSRANFTAAVESTRIDARNNLVGFQGDFTFDERVISFATEPVQAAGLTARNWNVAGNVLPGNGPIRTLRVSAFSTDFRPLDGIGTLFNLRIKHVNGGAGSSPLMWAAPPDNFIFINSDLQIQRPGNTSPGSVAPAQR